MRPDAAGVLAGCAVFHDRSDGLMAIGIAVILGAGPFTFLPEDRVTRCKVTRWWRRTNKRGHPKVATLIVMQRQPSSLRGWTARHRY